MGRAPCRASRRRDHGWIAAMLLCLSLGASQARLVTEAESPDALSVPKGYDFMGMVEFTEAPNHGRPHIHMDTAQESIDHPPEEQHTILITPDGRAYKKYVSDTLQEFSPEVFRLAREAHLGFSSQLSRPSQPAIEAATAAASSLNSSEMIGAASRKLHQVNQVASPAASIGVTTSSDDLSCNGCGPDNRLQVTDTTVYPFMTVGRLIGQLGTSTLGLECSGTLIGNNHVLTAAHCVFDINASRKMVANLNFAPALNGGRAPYGTIQWKQARVLSQFKNQPGYTTTAMNYDFALVTLKTPATSGYLSVFVPPSTRGTSSPDLSTAGYPGSKPSGTMWRSACGNTSIDYSSNNAFANVGQCNSGRCSNILTHTCISSDGQSGSGMWDTDYSIRAVLTGRVTVSNGDAYNVATEIDTEVYNQIASWYNEDATTEDKDTAGNGTLPLTPSGPGSQPAKQNAFTRWFKDNWGKSWFIAVVIIVCVGILGVLLIILVQFIRCCCGQPSQPIKPQSVSYANRRPQATPPARPPQPTAPAYPQSPFAQSFYSQGYPQSGYPPTGYPNQSSGYPQNSHMQYPVSAAAYR